jgi:hypothetical protein
MAKQFRELRERLLRGGVAPRHVRRYLAELADHLADLTAEEERAGLGRAEAESAALARLGDTESLASAMTSRRQFQSWSARAPWATFGLAPVFVLGGAWFVALSILWSGWMIFLPGVETPFVRVGRVAAIYFGAGRLLYYSAPFLVGWSIGLIATRQRLRTVWAVAGLVPIALIATMGHVHARLGHVGMGFTSRLFAEDFSRGALRMLVLVSVMALPYLLWQFRETRFDSA